jgi:8-oxo-dGTP diphosphatase
MNSKEPVVRVHGSRVGPVPWCRDAGDRGRAFMETVSHLDSIVCEPAWGGGELALTLVLTPERPPDDLVVSSRCVVSIGREVLVCETPNGPHIIPGGRREVGETWEATARREVREETGYELGDLTPLAVVLLHRDNERPDDPEYVFPHPDAFWVVFVAEPRARPTDGWVDVEGWERASVMMPIEDAAQLDLTPIDHALLRAIAPASGA